MRLARCLPSDVGMTTSFSLLNCQTIFSCRVSDNVSCYGHSFWFKFYIYYSDRWHAFNEISIIGVIEFSLMNFVKFSVNLSRQIEYCLLIKLRPVIKIILQGFLQITYGFTEFIRYINAYERARHCDFYLSKETLLGFGQGYRIFYFNAFLFSKLQSLKTQHAILCDINIFMNLKQP